MLDNYSQQQKTMVNELENTFANGNHKSTVVDMQKDYANDDQICLTSVVFIPNEISKIITDKIINPLRAIEPMHYYYPPDSMHLTIKNIRTINKPPLFSQTDIEKTQNLYSKIIPKFQKFEFNVEDAVLFPTSLSVMAYSKDTLKDLVLSLDKGLKEIGVPDNKKYLSDSVFWGNITVCRFTQKPSQEFIHMAKQLRNLKIGKFNINKISLITCNAVCRSRQIIAEYSLV
ncbi:MAG: hypothetical protein A3I29_01010 [Candidatus Magasanikbacteria bacterium RIFCSPLOWO2_02_FULL_44_11]|uniref:2'-5' RNA ligase n=2 Tax=Candidatus Magasanikiibacteriota TaxID=1752731 RepID=A0A1F6NA61_9BACT|nr:MAG: hypothetical protein A3D53_02145 [Candidatus Magasanikbacteria bacterium RIFCSPHIGHO2_02_FULL_45_10]OGH80678.1 MAG: hypothetical protein A3I29_01010 [Candidatus Magasanikbacteria bacterium RIFCSPLOWO2_02_FULL_44_11]